MILPTLHDSPKRQGCVWIPPSLRGLGSANGDTALQSISAVMAAAETNQQRWADVLRTAIARRAATCEEIELFNCTSVRLYLQQVDFRMRLIGAGAKAQDIDSPPLPIVFATEAKFAADPSTLEVGVSWRVAPCYGEGYTMMAYQGADPAEGIYGKINVANVVPQNGASVAYPDYESLIEWGTQPGGTPIPSELGAVPGVVWVILASAAAIAATGFIVERFLAQWKRDTHAEADLKANSQLIENNTQRATFVDQCAAQWIATLQPPLTIEQAQMVYAGCAERAVKLFPDPQRPRFSAPFYYTLLALGGVAAIGGAIWYARSR